MRSGSGAGEKLPALICGDGGVDPGAAGVHVGCGEDGAGGGVGALEEDVGDLDLRGAEALRGGEGVDRALDLVVGGAGGGVLAAEAVGLVVDDQRRGAVALDQEVDRAAQHGAAGAEQDRHLGADSGRGGDLGAQRRAEPVAHRPEQLFGLGRSPRGRGRRRARARAPARPSARATRSPGSTRAARGRPRPRALRSSRAEGPSSPAPAASPPAIPPPDCTWEGALRVGEAGAAAGSPSTRSM